MSFNAGRLPRVPTAPKGEQIASYDSYLEAQKAVDHLSDQEFPVQFVTIVGTDLKMVERITGRITYARRAIAGLASGAWFGLAGGLMLALFSSGDVLSVMPPAMAIGAAFGILFSVGSHALGRGQRDFTSASQIVASSYAVLCAAEQAGEARRLLQSGDGPGLGRRPVSPRAPAPTHDPAPDAPSTGLSPHSGSGGDAGEGRDAGPEAQPPTQPQAGPES
jgi:hypothetical protein